VTWPGTSPHDMFFSLISLYRGKVALDVAEAQHLMEGLDWQGAVKDIQASVKWLKSNGSPKVGVPLSCFVWSFAICICCYHMLHIITWKSFQLTNIML
jgi:hypothetical protein